MVAEGYVASSSDLKISSAEVVRPTIMRVESPAVRREVEMAYFQAVFISNCPRLRMMRSYTANSAGSTGDNGSFSHERIGRIGWISRWVDSGVVVGSEEILLNEVFAIHFFLDYG